MYPAASPKPFDSTVSPKRKMRPKGTRQGFALPALHQFEPVLTTSPRNGARPGSGATLDRRDEGISASFAVVSPSGAGFRSPSLLATPSPPIKPKVDDSPKVSPRIRPQPPLPAGMSSRTDQELYRYSQNVKQRMAIRPLFEQRREEEAELARRILTARETESAHRQRGGMTSQDEFDHAGVPERPEGTTRKRHSTPRKTDEEKNAWKDAIERDETEFVRVRFRTPTPPSSAGPCRSHLLSSPECHLASASGEPIQVDGITSEVGVIALEDANDERGNAEKQSEPESESLVEETSQSALPSQPDILMPPLDEKSFHIPFLEGDGPRLNRLKSSSLLRRPSMMVLVATVPAVSENESNRVFYKLLWKDVRVFDSISVMLNVFLSSNSQAHVTVAACPDTKSCKEGEESIVLPISNAQLHVSARSRPDLPILTPKWAKWIITRVFRDDRGQFFIRLEDIFAMEDSCCFSQDMEFRGSSDGAFSVAMYVVNEVNLLVHARSASSTSLVEVLLQQDEMLRLGEEFGFTVPSDEGGVSALLSNKLFLHKVATESKVLRLAFGSGLHTLEPPVITSECVGLSTPLTPEFSNPEDDSLGLRSQSIVDMYETKGRIYGSPELQELIRSHPSVATIAFLVQAYTEDGALRALRWMQRKNAVAAYVESYANPRDVNDEEDLHQRVQRRIELAKQAKLEELAMQSIVDDMINDFVALECRMELQNAKTSGGYDDFYASKVQATYRMSSQRREYLNKRHVRMRAARLIQALQRGIIARRRFCEMRVEREKYLFYGFRSSLHQSTARIEDPEQRASEASRETERRRQNFLMQVLHGYIAEHGIPVPFRIAVDLVQSIFNEYGIVVGCSATLGDSVAAVLKSEYRPKRSDSAPRLYSSPEINAALLVALRLQYDDTFGLASNTRDLAVGIGSPKKIQRLVASKSNLNENTPPRWLLKISPPFQRANRNRIASLRLTQKAVGQRAAHLVALDYRILLKEGFQDFEKCRSTWEEALCSRKAQAERFEAFSVDDLVAYALDRLSSAVKDWGLDPEPLFEALNLCLLHRHGKAAIPLAEIKFNEFADGINAMQGKRHILTLREEITQELEEFEALLASRCLNIALDNVVTVPPSEILHVLLHGKVDEEYLRYALPAVLPIASIKEKYHLAKKMMEAYANAAYAEAFNSICWSCLDVADNVTVEAARFVDRITRVGTDEGEERPDDELSHPTTCVAARALYLLTGPHALRFLQFLTKVAHFNKPLQQRVQELLEPYAAEFELYRIAHVVTALPEFELLTRLYDESFAVATLYSATRFWIQYESLYGLEAAEHARTHAAAPEENASVS